MAHHHHFQNYNPSNNTNDEEHGLSYPFFSLIIFFTGVTCIFLYSKYCGQDDINEPYNNNGYPEPVNEEEDDEFPDINDYFPDFLYRNRERQGVLQDNNQNLAPAPPEYQQGCLQNLEPPSYDSIVNPIAEANQSPNQMSI